MTWVRSPGREDPPGKEMAALSRILAWRIPWTEEPGGLQSTGSQRAGHDRVHASRSPPVMKGTSLESVLQADVKVGAWPRPLQGPSLLLQPPELHCLPSVACGSLQLRSQQCSVDFQHHILSV